MGIIFLFLNVLLTLLNFPLQRTKYRKEKSYLNVQGWPPPDKTKVPYLPLLTDSFIVENLAFPPTNVGPELNYIIWAGRGLDPDLILGLLPMHCIVPYKYVNR